MTDSNCRPPHQNCGALPTELMDNVAANCVTSFFYRGHTSRLNLCLAFNFSSRGFHPFSIGGFLPPATSPTAHLRAVFG